MARRNIRKAAGPNYEGWQENSCLAFQIMATPKHSPLNTKTPLKQTQCRTFCTTICSMDNSIKVACCLRSCPPMTDQIQVCLRNCYKYKTKRVNPNYIIVTLMFNLLCTLSTVSYLFYLIDLLSQVVTFEYSALK